MASVDLTDHEDTSWAPAHPWLWMLCALATGACAALWARGQWLGWWSDSWAGVGYTFGTLAFLTAAIALTLQWGSRGRTFLSDWPRAQQRQLKLGLMLLALGMLLGLSALLGLQWLDYDTPWNMGTVALVLCWSALICGAHLVSLLLTPLQAALTRGQETGSLLLLASLTLFCLCWGLYVDERSALDWDTMRLFLGGLGLATFLASGFCLLSRTGQRFVLSAAILLHFGGIMNSVMSVQPSPWLSQQLWVRFYRPYLEFMYLTNAYHFYAPDPGPSTFLWARIEYEHAGTRDISRRWLRIPEMQPNGQPAYPTALSYQRRMATVDWIARGDTPPPALLFNYKTRTYNQHPVYFWRQVCSPDPPTKLGSSLPSSILRVPYHTELTVQLQYSPPEKLGQKMLASMARYLLSQPHPADPAQHAVRVKLYRVRHVVANPQQLTQEFDPHHPLYYYPYYMGLYDEKGRLLDAPQYDGIDHFKSGDPFLYWLLPIVRAPLQAHEQTSTAIHGWVFQHAGDSHAARWEDVTPQGDWWRTVTEAEPPAQERSAP